MAEGDEKRSGTVPGAVEDNSMARLLTLSDGIFAIAMTLLALDIYVPRGLGEHPSNSDIWNALWAHRDSYWTYVLTFYVIGSYWLRHRRLLKSVSTFHGAIVRDTLTLLLFVAAMPFAARLLGEYGSEAISLAIYGGISAVATAATMMLSFDVRHYDLADGGLSDSADYLHRFDSWQSLVVFLLCIPAGFVLGDHGPLVFLLLVAPQRFIAIGRYVKRRWGRTSP